MTLKTDLTTDLSVCFDSDDFAEAATVGVNTIYGHLTDIYENITGVEGSEIGFMIKTSDATGIEHGTSIIINATTYYVINVQPGSALVGLTFLILSKDAP